MQRPVFDAEFAHVRKAVAAAPLRSFAVPHLIVDDIFTEDMVRQINDHWPSYGEGFQPETKGNHILCMYRRDYGRFAPDRLPFWQAFNETFWPAVVAATAEALAVPAREVFGDLYDEHLSIDMALTLMQAAPDYPGHSLHTHFYHCPHWAFTMLLYIDPQDVYSRGTSLHRLLPRGEGAAVRSGQSDTAYREEDLSWRADVAMDTFHWLDPAIPDRTYSHQVADYRSNRLFVFLDGPLAMHAVPFDSPDHSPDPRRASDGGAHARRRILRSHVKVHHAPFYAKHSALLPEPLDPTRYMRIMAPNAVLSPDDQRHRDQVLRPFFRERLAAYARAAARVERTGWSNSVGDLLHRVAGMRPSSSGKFMEQLVARIP